MKREIVESCLVVPSKETPKHKIWLSNLDLIWRGYTPMVYFYRSKGQPNVISSVVENLKASLAKTLTHLYPLAGRLSLDQDGRVEIDCTGEGVLLVVARSDSTVDDFRDFAPSSEMRQLLLPSSESGDFESPLVIIQVTFFRCGGVSFGYSLRHYTIDGPIALHFINTWSEVARGINNKLAIPTFFDRSRLRARSPPTILFDHTKHICRAPATPNSIAKPPFAYANLKLSEHQLSHLKNSTKRRFSTFKVVATHAWRCACKARELANDQETRLYTVVDVRSAFNPPLSQGFIGNAVLKTSAMATAGELVSSSLEFGAERIGTATDQFDDERYLRSFIDFLEVNKEVRDLAPDEMMRAGIDLWVVSWQQLPLYEADFWWGKPVYTGMGGLRGTGQVYIMRTVPEEDDGGLTISVGLEPASLERFKEVFYEDLWKNSGEGMGSNCPRSPYQRSLL